MKVFYGLIIFALTTTSAFSKKIHKKIVPIYDEQISFRHPDSWTPAVERDKDGYYSLEYLQKKEFSSARWTELFTVVAMKKAKSKINAKKCPQHIPLASKKATPTVATTSPLKATKTFSFSTNPVAQKASALKN